MSACVCGGGGGAATAAHVRIVVEFEVGLSPGCEYEWYGVGPGI